MDVLAHCRAMAAFCRQRVAFENEDDAFWIREAKEWDKLIAEYASRQAQIQTGQAPRSGNDDPSRTTGEKSLRETLLFILHGKARPENVFEKALEQRWHGSMPQRKQKHPVF